MKRGSNERWFVGGAGIVLVLSGWWFGYRSVVQIPSSHAIAAPYLSGDYQESMIEIAGEQVALPWRAPKPMARGDKWIYDVFTPPEVYYDAVSGRFRLTPPSRESTILLNDESTEVAKPGLILHAVKRERYPLQLIGFVGDPGNYLGIFENTVTQETLLLREGAMVDSLNMKVQALQVEMVAQSIPESMTVKERQVSAVILDQRSGKSVMLSQGAPAYTTALNAVVSLEAETGGTYSLSEGESLDSAEGRFLISEIRLAPAEVDVTKELLPDGATESHTLRPSTAEPPLN